MIHEKLMKLQSELKAPKTLENTFGGYKYRSAESILEAVKPLLLQNGLSQVITDEIVAVGERVYCKATVTLYDVGTGESIQASAYAREAETKKGMDDSQITGSTSSYARKYAMNGMYAIDDNQDADGYNDHGKAEATKPSNQKKPTPKSESNAPDIDNLLALASRKGLDKKQMTELWRSKFGAKSNTTDPAQYSIIKAQILQMPENSGFEGTPLE